MAPINIELFPCAGGMASGFAAAGITFDLSFEWKTDHCDSYEKNIGHRPICMDVRDLVKMVKAGWKVDVDLLCADPPCTPWSRAGKRKGTDDERDMLEEACELVKLLRPRRYIIGNVPGLDDSNNWHVVQRVIGGLQNHGYCVADFAALNAVSYGTPQQRIRPWWFGHREGPCIQWPAPTHADPDELTSLILPGITPMKPWVTCRQALGHLPPDELGRPVRLRKRAQNSPQHGSVPQKPARVVGTSNLSDGNVLLTEQHHPPSYAGEPAKTVRAGSGGGPNRAMVIDEAVAPTTRKRKTSRDRAAFEGGYTPSTSDSPAKTVVKNTHGNGTVLVLNDKHPPSSLDKPAPTMGAKQRGQQGAQCVYLDRVDQGTKHPVLDADAPAMTIRGGGDGHSAPELVLSTKHPVSEADAPARTVLASDGGGIKRVMRTRVPQSERAMDPDRPATTVTTKTDRANNGAATLTLEPAGKKKRGGSTQGEQWSRVHSADRPAPTVLTDTDRATGNGVKLEWPWDRPSTTLQADERLSPPGHHDDEWAARSMPEAVLLSEKAAAILQGLPEDWHFSGKSKKVRFSQLGQLMPPQLAKAVATSVAAQDRAARAAEPDDELARRRADSSSA